MAKFLFGRRPGRQPCLRRVLKKTGLIRLSAGSFPPSSGNRASIASPSYSLAFSGKSFVYQLFSLKATNSRRLKSAGSFGRK